jgi:hypothetical protein
MRAENLHTRFWRQQNLRVIWFDYAVMPLGSIAMEAVGWKPFPTGANRCCFWFQEMPMAEFLGLALPMPRSAAN